MFAESLICTIHKDEVLNPDVNATDKHELTIHMHALK